MQPTIRSGLVALAAAVLAGCALPIQQGVREHVRAVAPTALAAKSEATPEEEPPEMPKVYIVGASVTRLAKAELLRQIPGIVVDARDGRSMWHKGAYGEPSVMEVFRSLLPTLHAGDWVILETLHGAVPWDYPIPADSPWQVGEGYDPTWTNRRAWNEVVRLLPDDVCLGTVLPETNYGPRTDATLHWNDETARVLTEVVSQQPCHGLADWQSRVRTYSDIAEGGLGATLMYDGRHPTSTSGAWHYAQAVYWAMHG